MAPKRPKVSIGIPVFNGENYLNEAIQSILAQTLSDFEIIISDNASTDNTAAIAQQQALQNPAIKYFRQERNIGANANFNKVFELSKGEYFKWHAHDDLLDPQFLEKTVAMLDQHPDCVLCYTHTQLVDADGDAIEPMRIHPDTSDPSPARRLANVMLYKGLRFFEIFGLIRAEALDETDGMINSAAAERVVLGQLALQGPFHAVDAPLFIHRCHPSQSQWIHPTPQEKGAWVNPNLEGCVTFPEWRALGEYQRTLIQADLKWDKKLYSQFQILRYLNTKKSGMARDLRSAWKALRS